jgi:hypothetical protein
MERVVDPEIKAMGEISEALAGLEADAVRRVLKWAVERFQPRPSAGQEGKESGASQGAGSRTFLTLNEAFDAANPDLGLEKILVVAYWFQVQQGQEDWESFLINKELKNLGHPSGNITRDLMTLIQRKHVLQVRKDGKTQQARKHYKLTREGVKAVEKMINSGEGFSAT